MTAGIHTLHITDNTQLTEHTNRHEWEDDSKKTLTTAATENNMSEERGVYTNCAEQNTSDARGVCTEILSRHITSMGDGSNLTG